MPRFSTSRGGSAETHEVTQPGLSEEIHTEDLESLVVKY